MALNVYDGWSLDELLTERKRIQRRRSGGSVIEAAAAGVKSTKEYKYSDDLLLEDIAYALYLTDPVAYPLAIRESRTKAVVSG